MPAGETAARAQAPSHTGPHALRQRGAHATVAARGTVLSDPSKFGRVDDDGTAWVKTADGERQVGSWQAGDAAEGLAHFGRRFDDLATEVALLEARLSSGAGDAKKTKAPRWRWRNRYRPPR